MTLSKAITARAERTKHVYPSDRYYLAHRALSGDRDADFKWTRLVAKRRPTIWQRVRRWWS